MGYSIWFEFEEYVGNQTTDADGWCNIAVNYEDGQSQGFDVWTLDYFKQRLPALLEEAEREGITRMPDFIVTELTREHVTKVLKRFIPASP